MTAYSWKDSIKGSWGTYRLDTMSDRDLNDLRHFEERLAARGWRGNESAFVSRAKIAGYLGWD